MNEPTDILVAALVEEIWLSPDEVARACAVEPEWLLSHLEAGLIPQAERVGGGWRLTHGALARTRRMWQVERDFDAVPELAALVADLLEALDTLRARGG